MSSRQSHALQATCHVRNIASLHSPSIQSTQQVHTDLEGSDRQTVCGLAWGHPVLLVFAVFLSGLPTHHSPDWDPTVVVMNCWYRRNARRGTLLPQTLTVTQAFRLGPLQSRPTLDQPHSSRPGISSSFSSLLMFKTRNRTFWSERHTCSHCFCAEQARQIKRVFRAAESRLDLAALGSSSTLNTCRRCAIPQRPTVRNSTCKQDRAPTVTPCRASDLSTPMSAPCASCGSRCTTIQ